jgi:hypothetical protein
MSDLASAGTPEISNGGLISLPLQVYFTGMRLPSANAELVSFIEDLLGEDIVIDITAAITNMVQTVAM